MSSPKYGYYSIRESETNKCVYVYLDSSGKEVYVTRVSNFTLEGDELTRYFSDNKYVGEVTTYIKTVNLLTDSIAILNQISEPMPDIMSPRMYGYYSKQQSDNINCVYVYLDTNGNEVYVTQVNIEGYLEDDTLTKQFSDTKFVGEVTTYLRTVKL